MWMMGRPPGHTDVVLARAVGDRVIDQAAAYLIGDTSLERCRCGGARAKGSAWPLAAGIAAVPDVGSSATSAKGG